MFLIATLCFPHSAIAKKPPVICTRDARGNFPSMSRTETQYTNQRRVGGWRRRFLDRAAYLARNLAGWRVKNGA